MQQVELQEFIAARRLRKISRLICQAVCNVHQWRAPGVEFGPRAGALQICDLALTRED